MSEVKIDGNPEAERIVIDYLYGGKLQLSLNNVESIISCSTELGVCSLVNLGRSYRGVFARTS